MRRVASSALAPERLWSLVSSQSFSQLMSGVSAARLSRDDTCSQMYLRSSSSKAALTDFEISAHSTLSPPCERRASVKCVPYTFSRNLHC